LKAWFAGRELIGGCTLTRASRRLQKTPQSPRRLPFRNSGGEGSLEKGVKQEQLLFSLPR
jgi:hypothetical protein